MNIFKKQNSEDKKQDTKQQENAAEGKKQEDAQKPDPHKNGGCCGSCGGHKES